MKMYKILFPSVIFSFGLSIDVCPEFIGCEISEKQDSCPEGTFYTEKVKVHGCCPGCKNRQGENQICNVHEDCQPGLTCGKNKKCEKDSLQACEYYKRSNSIWIKTKYWNPNCLPDGSYAPKQCKGEKVSGKCFCVNKEGRRIFGEKEWSAAENMTCACSRLAEAMNFTPHCDKLGNFEPFQCDQKVCWCANPSTGIPYTPIVPIEMMTSLPCYSHTDVGSQYYRQCDSTNHIHKMTKTLLFNHGTTGIILFSQHCNFDGSFHRVQALREKKRCVYINNLPLTDAFESDDANCNCAFDKYSAELHRTEFLSNCLPNGSYKSRQVLNGEIYCVDEDGFQFSNDTKDCPSV